ncbi:MAG: cupin domain-containing protein [Armatimonadota bacterium]
MIVVHEDNAPTAHVPEPYRRTLKVLLSPVLHARCPDIAVGMTILPSGGMSDEHAHAEGEMFFVLAGNGRVKTEGGMVTLTPGTAAWSPSGESHQLVNDRDGALKILWVLCPPGREADILKNANRPLDGGG